MQIIIISILAWFIAQLTKVLSNLFLRKELDLRLFFASGGMPSAHSAFISSVATQIGLRNGFSSDIFILALAMAFIVTYDAVNVRRSVGLQGQTLNKMIEFIDDENDRKEIKALKVVLGHTPLQVFFGLVLGIGLVYLLHFLGII